MGVLSLLLSLVLHKMYWGGEGGIFLYGQCMTILD